MQRGPPAAPIASKSENYFFLPFFAVFLAAFFFAGIRITSLPLRLSNGPGQNSRR